MRCGGKKGDGHKCNGPSYAPVRPAQLLARAVAPFDCCVEVICGGRAADARSIMSLMAACVRQGDEIEIRCCGRQEQQALAAAVALVESGFGG